MIQEILECLLPGTHFIAYSIAQHHDGQAPNKPDVCRGGVLVRRAGSNRCRDTRILNNFACKIIPAAFAAAGAVVNAVLFGCRELQNVIRQIRRIGRIAKLVVYDFDSTIFPRKAQDGLDKVVAHIAVKLGGADNKVPGQKSRTYCSPRYLVFATNTLRVAEIPFGAWFPVLSRKKHSRLRHEPV